MAAPPRPAVPTLTLPVHIATVAPAQPTHAAGAPVQRLAFAELVEDVDFQALPDALTCPVCLSALTHAVETPCGHWFCRGCLVGSLRRNSTCPTCRTAVDATALPAHDSKSKERAVLDLAVHCRQRATGCDWVGSLRDLQPHMQSCGFVEVACPVCGDATTRAALSVHVTSVCRLRSATCEHCDAAMPAGDLGAHKAACGAAPVPCPNGCALGDVPRGAMPAHLADECALAMVPCPLASRGCRARLQRRHLAAHLRDAALDHNALLVSWVDRVEEQLARSERHNRRLEAAVNTLLARAGMPPVMSPQPFSLVATLQGHSRCVYAGARLRTKRVLATGSSDGTVRVWRDGEPVAQLDAHAKQVFVVVVVPVPSRPDVLAVATASGDGTVGVWCRCDGDAAGTDPDARNRSSVQESKQDAHHDADADVHHQSPSPSPSPPPSPSPSPSPPPPPLPASRATCLHVEGDAAPPAPAPAFGFRQVVSTVVDDGPVRALAVMPDGTLAVGRRDGRVHLWRLGVGPRTASTPGVAGKLVRVDSLSRSAGGGDASSRPPTAITALACVNPSTLVAGHQSGTVRLWRRTGSGWLYGGKLAAHHDVVYSVTRITATTFATASGDTSVRVWQVSPAPPPAGRGGGRPGGGAAPTPTHHHHHHHHSRSRPAAGAGSGAGIVSAAAATPTAPARLVATLMGHTAYVAQVAHLHDGALVSASQDCSVKVWAAADGDRWACCSTLRLAHPVYCVAALGGDQFLVGLRNGSAQVWNTTAAASIPPLLPQ